MGKEDESLPLLEEAIRCLRQLQPGWAIQSDVLKELVETLPLCRRSTIAALLPRLLEALVEAEIEGSRHLVFKENGLPLLLPLFWASTEAAEPELIRRLWDAIDRAVEAADQIFLV